MLTPGTIAAIILIPIGLVLAIVSAARFDKGRRNARPHKLDFMDDGWALISVIALPIAALLVIIPAIGLALVKFDSDYLTLKPVRGMVEEIASRQIADGKAMSTRYVAVIDGQPYGIDDTRAALIKPGDTISLMCTREFVYGSQDNGYACNWG